MRIGVDTGGTFTDCVVLDGGKIKILKVFSAPDTAAAILEGVRRLVGERVLRQRVDIIHGTTLGTNSLLECRGARVALVTTAGFEDLIEIGRQARPRLYDLNVQREPPLVPRPLRFGVKERTSADGRPLLRPTPAELRRLCLRVKHSGAESIALCFLFSFANPAHERVVARALRDLGLPVAASHEILPEFREYERLSTTVINAYLAPRMGEYLTRLERAAGEGLCAPPLSPLPPRPGRGRLFVMQSSGGITTAARAAAEPVRTILSGPAGGVVAAIWLAESLEVRRAISFDMGGTSTDACLVDGRARTTHETILGGLPIAIPMLDVHSVGAGGGSKARFDRGGALRVGPESAGAMPGPICYGRGGAEPTVTDAHLLLGRIDPDYFLGGTFQLDLRAAEEGFAEYLARQPQAPGLKTPVELARGIVAVCNATMEKALRVISVERGYDPRDFSLVSFGGAGGLHAADLARSLRLARVIIPQNPGAFSALGVLLADVVRDVSKSVLLPVPDAPRAAGSRGFFESLRRQFERLEAAARAELRRERFRAESARVERRLDVRYVGQSYELSVPFSADFRSAFHRDHEKVYGHAQPGRPLEIVNLRTRLAIRIPKPRLQHRKAATSVGLRAALAKQKHVWFGRRFWRTPLYHRDRLPSGVKFAGPAVIVEYSSTTVVPPDFICHVDEYLNLVLSPEEA